MAQDKHTRGPWKVVERHHPFRFVGDDEEVRHHKEYRIATEWEHPQLKDCWPVVTMSTGLGMEPGKLSQTVSMSLGDARLIAAAPEIMEALKLCMAVIGPPGKETWADDDDIERAWTAGATAIAKAEP